MLLTKLKVLHFFAKLEKAVQRLSSKYKSYVQKKSFKRVETNC